MRYKNGLAIPTFEAMGKSFWLNKGKPEVSGNYFKFRPMKDGYVSAYIDYCSVRYSIMARIKTV
jgi:hypothetical protein